MDIRGRRGWIASATRGPGYASGACASGVLAAVVAALFSVMATAEALIQPVDWLRAAERKAADFGVLTSRVIYSTFDDLTYEEQVRVGQLLYRPGTVAAPAAFRLSLDGRKSDSAAEGFDVIQRDLVYDGRYLLDVDHLARQVTRRDLLGRDLLPDDVTGEGGEDAVPLPLEIDAEALDRDYAITEAASAPEDPAGSVHIVLVPRDGIDADRLDLWIDATSELLVKARSTPDEGTVTEIVLQQFEPAAAEAGEAAFVTDLPAVGDGWGVQDVPFE